MKERFIMAVISLFLLAACGSGLPAEIDDAAPGEDYNMAAEPEPAKEPSDDNSSGGSTFSETGAGGESNRKILIEVPADEPVIRTLDDIYNQIKELLTPRPASINDRERVALANYIFHRAGTAPGVGDTGLTKKQRESPEGQELLTMLKEAQALIWAYDIHSVYEQIESVSRGEYPTVSAVSGLWAWNSKYWGNHYIGPDINLTEDWQREIPEVMEAKANLDKINAYLNAYYYPAVSREYTAAKEVDAIILEMDPLNAEQIRAARDAYNRLSRRSQARVSHLDILKKAEGAPLIPVNLVSSGVRAWQQGNGATFLEHTERITPAMRELFPGTRTEHIWITGGVSNCAIDINVNFNDIATHRKGGKMAYTPDVNKYPLLTLAEWQKQYINFSAASGRPSHKQYLDYFDENDIYVYLQVESGFADMVTLIDIYYDIFNVAERKCVLGFAIDVEWYQDGRGDGGLPVSDGKARLWAEHLYETWGEDKAALVLKHYNTTHMPLYYRGGGLCEISRNSNQKSLPVIFCNNSQSHGSWDGSVPGVYAGNTERPGATYGKGREYQFWAEQFPDNKMIWQVGYQQDRQWYYAFEDPSIQTLGIKLAEQATAHAGQLVGFAIVNFVYDDPLIFGINKARGLNQMLGYYASSGNDNLLGRRMAGNRAKQTGGSGPTLEDALVTAKVRRELNKLPDGENTAGINAENLAVFKALEPAYVDIRIAALPPEIIASRDYERVKDIWETYFWLDEEQKAQVTLTDKLITLCKTLGIPM